jgi:hypothetical protein
LNYSSDFHLRSSLLSTPSIRPASDCKMADIASKLRSINSDSFASEDERQRPLSKLAPSPSESSPPGRQPFANHGLNLPEWPAWKSPEISISGINGWPTEASPNHWMPWRSWLLAIQLCCVSPSIDIESYSEKDRLRPLFCLLPEELSMLRF